jgi:hypothetical protein
LDGSSLQTGSINLHRAAAGGVAIRYSIVHAGLCLLAASLATAQISPPGASTISGPGLHAATPAGFTVIQLNPSGAQLSLLALIECPEIEGALHVAEGLNATIISAEGVPLKHFPRDFSFRITASLRKTVLEPPESTIVTAEEPRQFLLKLGFRLKIYDGLDMREVEPKTVTLIGVPADIGYDERIFRLTFDVGGDLPLSDRLILEALSPQGESLTHFCFGLL